MFLDGDDGVNKAADRNQRLNVSMLKLMYDGDYKSEGRCAEWLAQRLNVAD